MTRHDPMWLSQDRRPVPVPLDGVAVLLRGWPRIAICALLACCLGAVYAYRIATPLYRTHVALMLEPQEANLIDLGRVLPSLSRDSQALNTQAQVLRSRVLVGRLVDRLGLAGDPEFNRYLRARADFAPYRALRQMLASGGILPEAQAAPATPEMRRDGTVNQVIRALDVTVEPESLVFSLSIATTEAAKSARIVNTLATLYIEDQVEAKLAATDQATVWLTDRVIELRRALEDAEALARSAQAERGLQQPSDLAELERRFAALRQRRTDPGLSQAAARGLAAEANALSARIRAASEDLVTVGQLERDAEATALLYESFLTRLKETAIQTGAHRADARILSQAVVPLHPAVPKPPLILLLAAILGIGLGALWVLAREAWRVRFHTAEDASQATGLTTLAVLPEQADRRRNPLEDLTRRPEAPLSAALRNLRSSILLSNLDAPPQVVMLTSSLAGEGKTTHALLLAESLATWGKTVLLIEADTTRAAISARLGVAPGRGLISVLAGLCAADEVIFRPAGLGFDVLAGEAGPANGADIFASGRFTTLLQDMRGRYDYILIDTPPVLQTADARIIAPAVDAVVYLLRWKHTTKAQLRRGLAQFFDYGIAVSGVALTRVRARR